MCRAVLTHYLIPSSVNEKLTEIPKEDSLQCLHCIAHVDSLFFTEMKSLILVLDPPKMENVSSYIMFLLLSDFHLLRKGWYTDKQTNPSDVLP